MNRNLFILTALASVLFFYSCTKEKSIDSTDPDAPQKPGSAAGSGLLVKTVSNFGLDSVVIIYGYDAQKRLTRQVITAQDPNFIDEDRRIVRSADGQIQQVVYKSDEYKDIGMDSVVYDLYYNGATYTHKILHFEDRVGIEYKDSTAYTYDAQNRIIKEEEFSYDFNNNIYTSKIKADFAYNGSGLVKVEIFHFDTDLNDYTLSAQLSYEYDDKESPLALGNEAIILQQYHLWSSHNPTKESAVYPDEPADNSAASATYTYNNKNKPLVATITEANTGLSFITTYYYQ